MCARSCVHEKIFAFSCLSGPPLLLWLLVQISGYFQCSSDLIMLLFDGFYTNLWSLMIFRMPDLFVQCSRYHTSERYHDVTPRVRGDRASCNTTGQPPARPSLKPARSQGRLLPSKFDPAGRPRPKSLDCIRKLRQDVHHRQSGCDVT